ncbi:MAG: hypothetical protein ACFFC7_33310 [Candidatus Hermodarchaeota archaeon]
MGEVLTVSKELAEKLNELRIFLRELRRVSLFKVLKGTVFPNSRERLALFINATPPSPKSGDGSKEFKEWADSHKINSKIKDVSTQKFLSASEMEVLAAELAQEISPLTRIYKLSLAMRAPVALIYLLARQISREVQLLQYVTPTAREEYLIDQQTYEEFPLPYITKWERFIRFYAFLATIYGLITTVILILSFLTQR